jgi:hypothetical protein
MVKYRGYTISHWAKPIPATSFDYDFSHEDYDGAPDSGDRRCGSGASVEDCKEQIDEIIECEEFDDFQRFVRSNLESWGKG